MSTLAHSEGPDETRISPGSETFDNTKTVFREKNVILYMYLEIIT